MIEIQPISKLEAVVTIPSSKSYSNRALLIAALADGESHIYNCLDCDDTRYMISALNSFKINIIHEEAKVIVNGCNGLPGNSEKNIFVGNAGTTMRFLCSFAALCQGETIIDGNWRMRQRPLNDLIDGLSPLGAEMISLTENGCPPVKIKGGGIDGGETEMNGDKSSQYFTSILLSSPYAKKDVLIKVNGELTSRPYIDLTIDLMKVFGVNVENNSYSSFFIQSRNGYKARKYTIETDMTSATYFFAAAAITGGKVRIENLNPGTMQGDIKFVDILKKNGMYCYYRRKFYRSRRSRFNRNQCQYERNAGCCPDFSCNITFCPGGNADHRSIKSEN